ncbi:hypothetical protein EF294_06655 [Gordonia oryzae]|uniref:Uncharacterized protein n=1 Tax=Gordonia oryzae TaxID=2487349 RepID=A0A3N4GPF1_9ACTN|nr:hypothetical protein EF294_06655 [Gordonia oryzae]
MHSGKAEEEAIAAAIATDDNAARAQSGRQDPQRELGDTPKRVSPSVVVIERDSIAAHEGQDTIGEVAGVGVTALQ